MAVAQVAEQVVERGADVGDVDLDVRERRRAERDDDVLGERRVGDAVGDGQRSGRVDAIESFLGAGLLERHPRVANRLQAVGVLVDAEDREAAVGERDGERETDPAEPDDSDRRH